MTLVLRRHSPVHEDVGFLSEGNKIIKGHESSTVGFRIKAGLLSVTMTHFLDYLTCHKSISGKAVHVFFTSLYQASKYQKTALKKNLSEAMTLSIKAFFSSRDHEVIIENSQI